MITAVRWISILLILAALLTIIRELPIDQAMGAIQGWTAGLGIWGPVVLALAYIVATVLFVPGTILTLAAGGMFGLVVGTITVSIGSTLGASLAFLIARYVARDKVAARASRNRRFGAIDRAIGEGGWKIVALLRLSPAIPFNLQNYLYGLTPIRFWPYVLTSWLAMLPGTFLYVYLGHIAGAAVGTDRSRTAAEWAMLTVGLLATVVVTVYVTRLARRKLQEQMNEAAEEEASPVTEEEAQHAPGDGVRLRGTIILAAVALVMAGAAVALVTNSTAFERWLAGLFGPPRVELKENQIEHEQIRPKFVEPRIHFALVCAAVGCPPLRNEVYDPACLDEQLAAQSESMHRHATWLYFDARSNVLRLTRLYDWYGDDFVQVAGSTADFAARYSPELKQALENGVRPTIEWLPYDWKSNSTHHKHDR